MKRISALILLFVCIITLVSCSTTLTAIDTRANHTFFPTERSDLHRKKLQDAYIDYVTALAGENSDIDLQKLEIYNFVSKKYSRRYDLDIFEVNEDSFFVMHKGELYKINRLSLGNQLITHIAVTDINRDGQIEILVALLSNYTGITAHTEIVVIDTKTKTTERLYGTDGFLHYFKENEEGVISVYYAEEVIDADKVNEGKLDESYYNKANNLLCTPSLNTVKYKFNEKVVQASCDLFSVEVTIDDKNMDFPYYILGKMLPPRFEVKVKMTYLGEPFDHTEGCVWLEGARISFVGENYEMRDDSTGFMQAVTTNHYYRGMEIDNLYEYYDYYTKYLDSSLENKITKINPVGIYDMVISFTIGSQGINESITIKDFLEITR